MNAKLDERPLNILFRMTQSQNGWRGRPLSEETLESIWDLVKAGPTSANVEPMRVVWCVSPESRRKLADRCAAKNAPKVLSAPATAIIGYDLRFSDKLPFLFPHPDARSRFTGDEALTHTTALRNGSLQAGYLILAVRALRVAAEPMSGFDEATVGDLSLCNTTIKVNFIC